MRHPKSTFLPCAILLVFLATGSLLFSQNPPRPKYWAVQTNLQHQDFLVQFRFGQLGVLHQVRFRPLYSIEAQRLFENNDKSKVFLSGQLSYYHNLYHNRLFGLKIGFGYETKQWKRFFASFRVSPGLGLTKNSDIQYVLEDGKWVPTSNFVPLSVNVHFTQRMDLGYRIKKGEHPLDLIGTSHLFTILNPSQNFLATYYGAGLGVRVGL